MKKIKKIIIVSLLFCFLDKNASIENLKNNILNLKQKINDYKMGVTNWLCTFVDEKSAIQIAKEEYFKSQEEILTYIHKSHESKLTGGEAYRAELNFIKNRNSQVKSMENEANFVCTKQMGLAKIRCVRNMSQVTLDMYQLSTQSFRDIQKNLEQNDQDLKRSLQEIDKKYAK